MQSIIIHSVFVWATLIAGIVFAETCSVAAIPEKIQNVPVVVFRRDHQLFCFSPQLPGKEPEPLTHPKDKVYVALVSAKGLVVCEGKPKHTKSMQVAGQQPSLNSVPTPSSGLIHPRVLWLETPEGNRQLVLSNSGKKIGYLAEEGGVSSLYVKDIKSKHAIKINQAKGLYNPQFSKNGKYIAWFRSQDDRSRSQLVIYDCSKKTYSTGSEFKLTLGYGGCYLQSRIDWIDDHHLIVNHGHLVPKKHAVTLYKLSDNGLLEIVKRWNGTGAPPKETWPKDHLFIDKKGVFRWIYGKNRNTKTYLLKLPSGSTTKLSSDGKYVAYIHLGCLKIVEISTGKTLRDVKGHFGDEDFAWSTAQKKAEHVKKIIAQINKDAGVKPIKPKSDKKTPASQPAKPKAKSTEKENKSPTNKNEPAKATKPKPAPKTETP